MKRFLTFIFVTFTLLVSVSCSKTSRIMDELVGTYYLTGSEYVTWGTSSGSIMVSDYITITATGDNTFQMTGYFNTTGTVIGERINFKNWMVSDYSGYLSYSIQSTNLIGGVMYLYASHMGQLKSNGISYPCNANYILTATKMY